MTTQPPIADRPFRRVHVVVSGFLQRYGDRNGMARLWRALHECASEDTAILHCTWNDDFRDTAEFVWRYRATQGEPTRIALYGYSWGVAGCIRLARELQKRGMGVDYLVSSDGVYRHWYPLGSWRAMVSWSRLVVPANVANVFWFRQRSNLPAGHDIVAEDRTKTQVLNPVTLTRTHQYMDDAPEFAARSIQVAHWLHGEAAA